MGHLFRNNPLRAIFAGGIILLLFCCSSATNIQAQAKPQPDVLLLKDGEKLIGQVVSTDGAAVTFKSNLAGQVTVKWADVQEFQSPRKYAVIPKSVRLRKPVDTSKVAQGAITLSGPNLQVAPGAEQPAQSVPLAGTGHVMDDATFQKAISAKPGFFQDWTGAITAGASLVQATQNSRDFNGAISLVRTVPGESWLEPQNRTLIDFSTSYGEISQPNTPTLKTDIYHADAERDEYFSPSLYAFAQGAFDHNFAQGLDLQQTYSGGIGWTVFKTGNAELDLKGGLSYIDQQFAVSSANQTLFGSVFGENYMRKLPRGMVLVEALTITPAWNNLNAYSAAFSTTLTAPIYKKLNFSAGVIDTYLNNPPPGFKKNSLQFTSGLTYAIP